MPSREAKMKELFELTTENLKSWTKVFLLVLPLLSGMGLLALGELTNNVWAVNVGLFLILIGAIPVAYQLAKSEN